MLHVRGLAKCREEFIDVIRQLTRQRCEESFPLGFGVTIPLRSQRRLKVGDDVIGWQIAISVNRAVISIAAGTKRRIAPKLIVFPCIAKSPLEVGLDIIGQVWETDIEGISHC